MSDTKLAKFFCESCGAEVKANARVCPKCGRFFASVKCPKCGMIGDQNMFKNGCPRCGYAVNGSHSSSNKVASNVYEIKHKKSPFGSILSFNRGGTSGDALPAWIYIASILALIAIISLCLVEFR
ncbi:MAG: zinc-ribbon domain-containing protein [Treponema sp.]|nr:zinc-ribbon domain-containing protein [Treponema sp.]